MFKKLFTLLFSMVIFGFSGALVVAQDHQHGTTTVRSGEVLEKMWEHLTSGFKKLAKVPDSIEEYKCKLSEERIGYPGFMHCELHPQYQEAFKDWGCHCYTGQCRPTIFRPSQNEKSVTGYEIFISGDWFEIPKEALRKQKANMTGDLLRWEAHVCTSEPPTPHIECAIILPSS